MKKVKLGNTDTNVSTLCLGAMYFGTKQTQDESFTLLDQFAEAGGNFIDTANIYAHWIPNGEGGDSETCIGRWIRACGNRDKVVVATKVGFPYNNVPQSLKANIIEEECNKSLRRMGLETIDLFYAHVDDRSTPIEETLEAFHRLVLAGKVRYIGASNYMAWRLEEASWKSERNGWPEYQCVQQRHTYLRRIQGTTVGDPQVDLNDDLQDYCRNRDLTLLAYSPLLSGAYTREDRQLDERFLGADTDKRMTTLRAVAAEIGATLNQVVLAWMLGSDPQVIPLIAASSKEQMAENLAVVDIQLTKEQMDRLNTAGPPKTQ